MQGLLRALGDDDGCDSIGLSGDHPLLWSCLDQQGSLYFSGTPGNVSEVIGRLWQRHHRETQGWVPFEQFLNPQIALDTLLGGGFGLLASGPERLLLAYAQELDAGRVPWSIAGRHPAKSWNPASGSIRTGGSWVVEDRPPQVLTLGKSYIIAVSFSASER